MITGIVVALPEELRTLTRTKIRQGECISLPNGDLVSLSGTGIDKAQLAAQQLIKQGAQQLMSWGCAGALSPTLKPGDLILPHSLLLNDNTLLEIDKIEREQVIKRLHHVIPYYSDKILETKQVISTVSDKATSYQRSSAIAVDMESGAVARIAKQANIPFIVIRSIVDPAHFNLPYAVQYAINQQGNVSMCKLLLYLCMHPTELPRLITLGQHFNAAKKTLNQVAAQLLFSPK